MLIYNIKCIIQEKYFSQCKVNFFEMLLSKEKLLFSLYIKNSLFNNTKKAKFVALNYWELSSVGSEHLVYTQGVTGSNPVVPTYSKSHIIQIIRLSY